MFFYSLVIVLVVLVAALLMVVVLMQSSKGGGLAALGAGGGDAAFGSRQAATILHKTTIYLVSLFLFLCLLATMLSRRGGSGEVMTATSRALQEQATVQRFNENIPVVPEVPATEGSGE